MRASLLPALLAAAVTAVAAARRWQQMGPLPTGLDGGQWLAIGRGLTGVGRSTEGAYAPLVPVLTAVANHLAGPMTGLKIVAMLGLLATLAGATTLGATGLAGPWLPLLVLGVASASAVSEPVAYGGYPQLLAFGAMLAATAVQARAVASPERRLRVAVAALLVLAAFAHHVYGPLALLCAFAVWLVDGWRSRSERTLQRQLSGLLPLVPATAVVLVILAAFRHAGYSPPLDAARLGHLDAFLYATREAPPIWAAVVGGMAVAIARPRPDAPLWLAAVALVAVPGLLFLASPEPRLLPPVLVGSLALLLRSASGLAERRSRRVAVRALLLAGLAWLAVAGDDTAVRYFAFYRVADPSLIAATRSVEDQAGDGIIAVRDNQRGWPVGWWWEGLTTRPVAVGSDPRWLGFPQERAHADLAARFFAAPLSARALRALASDTGVRLLVCNPHEWIGWQHWLDDPSPPVTVLYDDGETLVMRVRPGSP